jgi:bifunctional non-homologous end joining protein LigD
MKSSTTGFGSWPGATAPVSGLLPATAMILPDGFRWLRAAVAALPGRSCLIDGEAIVCDDKGLAVFELIRRARNHASVILCAFDLLEIDGEDLRRVPIEQRKHRLARLLRRPPDGIGLNEHFSGEGAVVFKHVCKLGCEGIVSKRLGSSYRSGRSQHWIKVKNPKAPAVKREAEEDWR